jgi:hypothetical protein
MGEHRNLWPLNLLGGLAATLMAGAVLAMLDVGARWSEPGVDRLLRLRHSKRINDILIPRHLGGWR